MADDLPDFISPLVAGMVQLHEVFQAAIDAGFPEHVAADLVKEIIKAAMTP